MYDLWFCCELFLLNWYISITLVIVHDPQDKVRYDFRWCHNSALDCSGTINTTACYSVFRVVFVEENLRI